MNDGVRWHNTPLSLQGDHTITTTTGHSQRTSLVMEKLAYKVEKVAYS